MRVESAYLVDNSGNLSSFDLECLEQDSSGLLMKVKGKGQRA